MTLYSPNQLRTARYALRLTVAEASKGSTVSTAAINNMEMGRTDTNARTLKKLQDFYVSLGAEFQPGGWVRCP